MASQEIQVIRRVLRMVGALVMGLALSAAIGDLPAYIIEVAFAVGAGLVIWGSLKAKVERQAEDIHERVTLAEFRAFVERIDRIEDKLDRLLERP